MAAERQGDRPILIAHEVVKKFVTKRGLLGRPRETVQAVAGVSFELAAGQTLGIVGETGSGKSTLGRLITHLIEPDSGHVVLDGQRLDELSGRALLEHRSKIQMVFQDPRASLDPQRTIEHAITEPLKVHRRGTSATRATRVRELIASVGLSERHLGAYPAQLSGGQRQRVAIARALAIEPEVIVADEPTSALDLSTRSEILNLLMDVQDRTGVALVLISHDLSVVRHLSDRTAVMYLGRLVEVGDGDEVSGDPQHPYTMALMSAAPVLSTQERSARLTLHGDAPNPADPPSGCRFHPRCSHAVGRCRTEDPVLEPKHSDVQVACHLVGIAEMRSTRTESVVDVVAP